MGATAKQLSKSQMALLDAMVTRNKQQQNIAIAKIAVANNISKMRVILDYHYARPGNNFLILL